MMHLKKLQKCWERCICAEWDYFNGEGGHKSRKLCMVLYIHYPICIHRILLNYYSHNPEDKTTYNGLTNRLKKKLKEAQNASFYDCHKSQSTQFYMATN
jgi:hypothetical protein